MVKFDKFVCINCFFCFFYYDTIMIILSLTPVSSSGHTPVQFEQFSNFFVFGFICSQLKQLEEEREAEQEDIKEVTDEFTRRLAEAEKKFQAAIKEKDMYKKAMQDTELGKRLVFIMYHLVVVYLNV